MGNVILGILGFIITAVGCVMAVLAGFSLTSPNAMTDFLDVFKNYIIDMGFGIFLFVIGVLLMLIGFRD
jgi:hypothetical protein